MASATIVREAIWLEEHGVDADHRAGRRGRRPSRHVPDRQHRRAAGAVRAAAAGGRRGAGAGDRRRRHRRWPRHRRGVRARRRAACRSAPPICAARNRRSARSARAALAQASDDSTVITNVMTGRPARGVANRVMREVGPVSADAPAFPHAASALGPLKAAAEKHGRVDFTNLWAGQAVRLGHELPAAATDPGAGRRGAGAAERARRH